MTAALAAERSLGLVALRTLGPVPAPRSLGRVAQRRLGEPFDPASVVDPAAGLLLTPSGINEEVILTIAGLAPMTAIISPACVIHNRSRITLTPSVLRSTRYGALTVVEPESVQFTQNPTLS